jgi:hypothetical protein
MGGDSKPHFWPYEKEMTLDKLIPICTFSTPARESKIKIISTPLQKELFSTLPPIDNCQASEIPKTKVKMQSPRQLIRQTRSETVTQCFINSLHQSDKTLPATGSRPISSHYLRPKLMQPYGHVSRTNSGRFRSWRSVMQSAEEWGMMYQPNIIFSNREPVFHVKTKKNTDQNVRKYALAYKYPSRNEPLEEINIPFKKTNERISEIDDLSMRIKLAEFYSTAKTCEGRMNEIIQQQKIQSDQRISMK